MLSHAGDRLRVGMNDLLGVGVVSDVVSGTVAGSSRVRVVLGWVNGGGSRLGKVRSGGRMESPVGIRVRRDRHGCGRCCCCGCC